MPKRPKTMARETATKSTKKAGDVLRSEEPSPADIQLASRALPNTMARLRRRADTAASDPQTKLFGSIRNKEKARDLLALEILAEQREIERLKPVAFRDRKPLPRTPFAPVPRELLFATDIKPIDKVLFAILQLYCQNKRFAWPSQELLSQHLDIDVRTIQRSLSRLVNRGYILIKVHRKTNGCRHINTYWTNLEDDRSRSRS